MLNKEIAKFNIVYIVYVCKCILQMYLTLNIDNYVYINM